jgi:hypothetical protein
MIFLSHNYKDKPIIEQFALALSDAFGREQVFYDSWSIQPGDGIIDQMSSGLKSCKFFLFFVSENSLNSSMVKLEWQNALMKAANNSMKFVPIRLDRCEMPILLTQTLYIDLFNVGLTAAVRQTIDVVSGKNTYSASPQIFSNLRVNATLDGQICIFTVEAEHFMEPISSFLFMFTNAVEELFFFMPEEPAFKAGNITNMAVINNKVANGQTIGLDRATTPGHPFKVKVTIREGVKLELLAVMHERSKNEWATIPLTWTPLATQ